MAVQTVGGATSIEVGGLARLTLDQYEELARLDVISGPRIECVNGLLVKKTTKKPRHSYSIEVIDRFLRSVAPVAWYVRVDTRRTAPWDRSATRTPCPASSARPSS